MNKRVLIISHNPLSRINNNGKTLVSLFKGIPEGNIYQIYLNSDIPDYDECCHYLQINEKQILGSLLKGNNLCCQEVNANPNKVNSASIKANSFGIYTKRLLRECIWKTNIWKSKLTKWLENKQFDVVFFMAGDGLFAYDVYCHVIEHLSSKRCLFFTDDYILGKVSSSPVAIFRQFLLKRKMKSTLSKTQELYVISEEMRDAYYKLFNKDGYVIRNYSIEKKESYNLEREKPSSTLNMVYAGGLHYNRWKVLSQIAASLKIVNDNSKTKCNLLIYSAQNISQEIIDSITVDGVSKFCGGVRNDEIADIYANSDILLHVESFEERAIASTKYSFSTKIPEYLSASKCILAVGPKEVASISYLSHFACVIANESELLTMLSKLIENHEYREKIRTNCITQFEKDFSKTKQIDTLRQIFSKDIWNLERREK